MKNCFIVVENDYNTTNVKYFNHIADIYDEYVEKSGEKFIKNQKFSPDLEVTIYQGGQYVFSFNDVNDFIDLLKMHLIINSN